MTGIATPRLAPVLCLLAVASACLPRERFNKSCDWTGDSPRLLDVRDARDAHHLIEDAQLAEELMVRYADFRHKQPFGYEGHGGLLEGGRVARECLAKLDGIIQSTHGVTRQAIVDARQQRDWRFDAAVLISFVVLYTCGAAWMCRSFAVVFRRIGPSVLVLLAGVVSLAGFQLLDLWATTAEMIRVGNDHLGPHRGQLIPWQHHFRALLAGGMTICLTCALLSRGFRSEEACDSGAGHGQPRALLR